MLDPLWPEPKTKLLNLLDYLGKVTDLVANKACKMCVFVLNSILLFGMSIYLSFNII